jgi:hypothetical protein
VYSRDTGRGNSREGGGGGWRPVIEAAALRKDRLRRDGRAGRRAQEPRGCERERTRLGEGRAPPQMALEEAEEGREVGRAPLERAAAGGRRPGREESRDLACEPRVERRDARARLAHVLRALPRAPLARTSRSARRRRAALGWRLSPHERAPERLAARAVLGRAPARLCRLGARGALPRPRENRLESALAPRALQRRD